MNPPPGKRVLGSPGLVYVERVEPARPPTRERYVNPERRPRPPVHREPFSDSWPTYVFLAAFCGLIIVAFMAGFFFHAILERL